MSAASAPDLVIFDCDGVLIDSEPLACRNAAECFTEHGFPITEAEIAARFLGRSGAAMLGELQAQFGRPIPAEALAVRRQRLITLYERELKPVAGICELLDALAVRCCVGSSGTPEYLQFSLGLVGLYDRFAPNVFSAAMVERGKPAPDLFLFAAAQLGVEPQACVVVEDSPAGVHAAVAAGMTVLGFTGGSHCAAGHGDTLLRAGAAAVFCDFSDPPPQLAAAMNLNQAPSAPAPRRPAKTAPVRPG